jgi:hypothetical protein
MGMDSSLTIKPVLNINEIYHKVDQKTANVYVALNILERNLSMLWSYGDLEVDDCSRDGNVINSRNMGCIYIKVRHLSIKEANYLLADLSHLASVILKESSILFSCYDKSCSCVSFTRLGEIAINEFRKQIQSA